MKEDGANKFYDLALNPGQAVVTKPRTLLQLRNEGSATAAVLYIVSPSYVVEMDSDTVVYDDAVVVAKSWEELEARAYDVPALAISATEAEARREEAKHRLAAMKASSARQKDRAARVVPAHKPRQIDVSTLSGAIRVAPPFPSPEYSRPPPD